MSQTNELQELCEGVIDDPFSSAAVLDVKVDEKLLQQQGFISRRCLHCQSRFVMVTKERGHKRVYCSARCRKLHWSQTHREQRRATWHAWYRRQQQA